MQTRHASQYANQLLTDLGAAFRIDEPADHPAIAWRRSGLLKTTGLMLPLPLANCADGALMALKVLAPQAKDLPEYGSLLLGERAILRQTIRKDRHCAGGYGRLIDTLDGRIALNLVREEDWDLVPAWLEAPAANWDAICDIAKTKSAGHLSQRAAEIGLAVAEDHVPKKSQTWVGLKRFNAGDIAKAPLIVDLSGLWAGPLASSLLQMMGARVIKIESPLRPDGMRFGHKGFYNLLNAGKDCVALNFRDTDDLSQLKTLLHKADIVIEASRPRALRQLGIEAEDFVKTKSGKIWARLTAYGQTENRIGFGDDIAISAGLATIMDMTHGQPCFVGDAIADPMNGLHLALVIYTCYLQGGGAVIDISMRDILRYAMGDIPKDLPLIAQNWQDLADKDDKPFYPMRQPLGQVKALGEDNAAWLC